MYFAKDKLTKDKLTAPPTAPCGSPDLRPAAAHTCDGLRRMDQLAITRHELRRNGGDTTGSRGLCPLGATLVGAPCGVRLAVGFGVGDGGACTQAQDVPGGSGSTAVVGGSSGGRQQWWAAAVMGGSTVVGCGRSGRQEGSWDSDKVGGKHGGACMQAQVPRGAGSARRDVRCRRSGRQDVPRGSGERSSGGRRARWSDAGEAGGKQGMWDALKVGGKQGRGMQEKWAVEGGGERCSGGRNEGLWDAGKAGGKQVRETQQRGRQEGSGSAAVVGGKEGRGMQEQWAAIRFAGRSENGWRANPWGARPAGQNRSRSRSLNAPCYFPAC